MASPTAHVLAALAVIGLTGCGATLPESTALGLPKLDPSPVIDSPPTEVYARIAGGALGCWFGANGALKPSHIFHAEAASPASGGAAEIIIHERDPSQPNPRGARALIVSVAGQTGSASVVALNSTRFADDRAAAMRTDVLAWANGASSCEMRRFEPPLPELPPEPATKSKKKKVVAKKST